MIGDMVVNTEGKEVGMVVHRIVPVYIGTDFYGSPEYRYVLSEQVMLFNHPELVFNFCDN
jgi:hypothetical protein